MIDPYSSFRITDDGSVIARNDDGTVQFGSKWTAPAAVATIVRLAIPAGAAETTGGAALTVDRDAAISGLAATVDDEEQPLLPSEHHAAAVLDFLVEHDHAAREGERYYFHPPGGASTGLGYAGALYAVADATASTAATIESIETTMAEQPDEPPAAIADAADKLDGLSGQREALTDTAEQIRANATTVERAVLEQATLDRIDIDAIDRLGEAVEQLAHTVEQQDTGADDSRQTGE